jgi:hypothetical protein
MPGRDAWLEVAEGISKKAALASAERKRTAAHNLGVTDAEFIALPAGQQPPVGGDRQ